LTVLALLRSAIEELNQWVSKRKNDYGIAEVDVEATAGQCEICGKVKVVQKTVTRTVATLSHGRFRARERVMYSPCGCKCKNGAVMNARDPAISALVPPGANYGYDLEVFVGLERFIHHRQREEIRSALSERYSIEISSGEVSVLADRFLAHLEALHRNRANYLRAVHRRDCGYTMHIDATTEGGGGTLLVVLSGWRRWVLGAWRIPSESTDAIRPCITETCAIFGEPCAIVSDLGLSVRAAAVKASETMSSKPKIFACHFHFLRDVGKDILTKNYERLRKQARSVAIKAKIRNSVRPLYKVIRQMDIDNIKQYFDQWAPDAAIKIPAGPGGLAFVAALAQWVLDYQHDGKNMGFPFDLPYYNLYLRCCKANNTINFFIAKPDIERRTERALERLSNALIPFIGSKDTRKTAANIKTQSKLFDKFRAIFRLDTTLPDGLGEDGNAAALFPDEKLALEYERQNAKMRNKALAFSENLKECYFSARCNEAAKEAISIILDHMHKHGAYLWGHMLKLHSGDKTVYRIVHRTNNVLESFFHRLKHYERRRCGRKLLTKDFESYNPAAAIALNLEDPVYVKEICGSLEQLPKLFSKLDQDKKLKQFNEYGESSNITVDPDIYGDMNKFAKFIIRKESYQEWIIRASFSNTQPLLRQTADDDSVALDDIEAIVMT
jgi:hypothetical protein